MKLNQDFEEFITLLNRLEVNYLVVGGYAYAIHAEPRFTKDLDIFIKRDTDNAGKIIKVLKAFGFASLQINEQDFLEPDRIVQLGQPPMRIDLLTSISGVDFESAWKNKVKGRYGDQIAWFIGKADLIKNKKATGRKSDLNDLEKLEDK